MQYIISKSLAGCVWIWVCFGTHTFAFLLRGEKDVYALKGSRGEEEGCGE